MKQFGDHFFLAYTLSDAAELVLNPSIKNNNLILIIPGMLDTDVSDSEYADVVDTILDATNRLKWNIVIIHNQSSGILLDLGECVCGKLLGSVWNNILQDPPEYPGRMLKTILDARPANVRTMIMAHSQGGIIATNAVNACSIRLKDSVELNFFGTANWFPPDVPNTHMVNYTNRYDLVAYLFGRGLVNSTVKLKTSGHQIIHYQHAMCVVLQHTLGLLPDDQFNEAIKNV